MKKLLSYTIIPLLALSLIGISSSDAEARRLRLEIHKTKHQSSRQLAKQRATGAVVVVRVTGELRYSRRTGLTFDGMSVQLRDTAFYPADGLAYPSGRQLSGHSVTMYGIRTARGFQATMIIDHDAQADALNSDWSKPVMGIPGPNPHASTLTEDTPS